MDGLRQHVDRDSRLDREDALVDRRGRVWAGHRRPDELARAPVHDDRHVPGGCLHRVAPGARRVGGDALEGIDPGCQRLVQREADGCHLRRGVGGPRQRPVVGFHGLTESDPHDQLALVVALVGMQFRPGRIAGDPQAVGQAQRPVPAVGARSRDGHAVLLQAKAAQRELAPDGEQGDVALYRRPVLELHDVGSVAAAPRPSPERTHAGPHLDAVGLEGEAKRLGTAWVLGGSEAGARLHDGHRDAEPGEDLRQLTARGPAAEDQQAPGELACQRRLSVRPGLSLGETLDRGALGCRPHSDDDVPRAQVPCRARVRDLDNATARDPALPAQDDRPGGLQRPDVRGVVRFGGVDGPVDHVVAAGRCPGPRVVLAGRMAVRGVEQALGRDAAHVGTGSPEPLPVHDGHRRAHRPRLVRRRLAGGAGTDHNEVEHVHGGHRHKGVKGPYAGNPRWRRASYRRTAAAIDTLRLSATPSIGSRTGTTPSSVQAPVRPAASLPSTIARGPRMSTSV